MKPDNLLSDLTPCTTDASFLVAAARQRVRHRRQFQLCTAAAALTLATVTALRLLPTGGGTPSPNVTVAAPSSPMPAKQRTDPLHAEPLSAKSVDIAPPFSLQPT